MLSLTILGSNSAIPAYGRNPTAQVLQTSDEFYLIDCGEGTQSRLQEYKVKRSRINNIFISHLHGDHYFGLIGLLTSMGLMGRTADMHIYCPKQLKDIIDIQLKVADTILPYRLNYHFIEQDALLLDDKKMSVSCFAVQHRIECWGFLFREKRNLRKINKDKLKPYSIPSSYYDKLQQGQDYTTPDGQVIKNEWVTDEGTVPKSYAYSADTIFDTTIAEKVKGVDLLYHETTYLKEHEHKAKERYHSTTIQAAAIARLAGVKKLLIGHFSSKYEFLDEFLEEARQVFENTELALEGTCHTI